MKKTLNSIILGSSLALIGSSFFGCSTNQTPINTQIQKKINEINCYEIPTGNYTIIEVDPKKGCALNPNLDPIKFKQGRILIKRIDHQTKIPLEFNFKIQRLEQETENTCFTQGTYSLRPGEYEIWILNKGFKAPIQTFKSNNYIQLTPEKIMNPEFESDMLNTPISNDPYKNITPTPAPTYKDRPQIKFIPIPSPTNIFQKEPKNLIPKTVIEPLLREKIDKNGNKIILPQRKRIIYEKNPSPQQQGKHC